MVWVMGILYVLYMVVRVLCRQLQEFKVGCGARAAVVVVIRERDCGCTMWSGDEGKRPYLGSLAALGMMI